MQIRINKKLGLLDKEEWYSVIGQTHTDDYGWIYFIIDDESKPRAIFKEYILEMKEINS